jgi:excisionase family DNA binding protein
MSALAIKLDDLHEPSPDEVQAARVAARALSRNGAGPVIRFAVEGESAEPITLPASIFALVVDLLSKLGNGNAVTIVPVEAELTTQQAADYLNVSRPHLIKLLERGSLPFRMVGTHRKVLARDIINYRSKVDGARYEALRAMTTADADFGIDTDELVGTE